MSQDKETLAMIYEKLEKICDRFQKVLADAAEVAQSSHMPSAALQLNDVLQSTEQASLTIIEAASLIDEIVGKNDILHEDKLRISNEIGRIYEASSFQDINGQRIKIVLQNLSDLEKQFQDLFVTARASAPQKKEAGLLNGPQLASEAPNQEDIDKLFDAP